MGVDSDDKAFILSRGLLLHGLILMLWAKGTITADEIEAMAQDAIKSIDDTVDTSPAPELAELVKVQLETWRSRTLRRLRRERPALGVIQGGKDGETE